VFFQALLRRAHAYESLQKLQFAVNGRGYFLHSKCPLFVLRITVLFRLSKDIGTGAAERASA
jgi:hypothetical protein